MATTGQKISEQTIAASLDGNELFPFAKEGENGAVSANQIKAYVSSSSSTTANIYTDEYTGIVCRRGYMPDTSQPGEVYRGLPVNENGVRGVNYVIKVKFKDGELQKDLSNLFSSGDWSVTPDKNVTVVGSKITVNKDTTCDFTFVYFTNLATSKNWYITKNSKGQIIKASRHDYEFRKAVAPQDLQYFNYVDGLGGNYHDPDYESKKLNHRTFFAYMVNDSGERYDIQWRRPMYEHNKCARGQVSWSCRWRYSVHAHTKRCRIFRVRRRTRTTVSAWTYYTFRAYYSYTEFFKICKKINS